MPSGINLVNKIDILAEELGLTRKEFAEQIDLKPSTIATWKTKNILPPVETLFNIACYFEVSFEWLVLDDFSTGIANLQQEKNCRKQIRKRIYDSIAKKQNINNADNPLQHQFFFTNMPDLTYRLLYNWAEGRINLNEFVLVDIAYLLGINLDYLFSKQENNSTIAAENDKYILETAHRNLNDLFCLDNLTAQRKQTASSILNQLMELEHFKYIQSKNNSDDNSHH